MDNTVEKFELNRSQSEIALSEEVFLGSALNTISVTMYFEKFSVVEVAAACDRVFQSADIFSAALVKEGNDYFFYSNSRDVDRKSVV